jgi:hypothetical protein
VLALTAECTDWAARCGAAEVDRELALGELAEARTRIGVLERELRRARVAVVR